MLRLCFQSF